MQIDFQLHKRKEKYLSLVRECHNYLISIYNKMYADFQLQKRKEKCLRVVRECHSLITS